MMTLQLIQAVANLFLAILYEVHFSSNNTKHDEKIYLTLYNITITFMLVSGISHYIVAFKYLDSALVLH